MSTKVGVIGLGRMGSRIVTATGKAGFDFVAGLDSSAEPWAAKEHPEAARHMTTSAETFWASGPDVVAIATTADAHMPLLQEGLRRGVRRFLIEKPFAQSVASARAVLAEAERVGARVIVNHVRRYHSGWNNIKHLDGSDETGPLRSVSILSGGGSTGCLGVHWLDLCLMLFGGLPQKVTAGLAPNQFQDPRGERFDDPGSYALLEWADGRRALLEMAGDLGIGVVLELRFAIARMQLGSENQPWQYQCRKTEDRDLPFNRYGQPLVTKDYQYYTPLDLIDLSACALQDAAADGPALAGAQVALETLTLFSAIRWAAHQGGTVTLPLPAEAETIAYAIP